MVKKKNISIKEIAKLADVSVATVSRVINNNGRFSDKTKEKVEQLLKNMVILLILPPKAYGHQNQKQSD